MVKTSPAHYSIEERKAAAELSGDMTASDVIETLAQMRFRTGTLAVRLDKDARDFLLASVIARRGKA